MSWRNGVGLPEVLGECGQGQMSVADVLALQPFRRGRPQVLAGDSALGRAVRWAHVFDVTEVQDLLRGGEFILSTGAPLGTDQARLRRFIDQLADQEAAALAIEIGGTYADAVPSTLVERAEERALPLIVFRRQVRFVEITEAIHKALIDRETDLLRRGAPLQRRIDAIALGGGGAPELVEELAVITRNPVVLQDNTGDIVALGVPTGSEQQALDVLQRVSFSGDTGGILAVNVQLRGSVWGQVKILELDSELDYPLARTAAERAAVMISMSLARDVHESMARAQTQGAFLEDLGAGVMTERSAEQYAMAFGLTRAGRQLIPIVVAWRRPQRARGRSWSSVLAQVMPTLDPCLSVLVGQVGEDLVLVVASEDEGDVGRIQGAVSVALKRAGTPAGDATIARGGAVTSWLDVAPKLRQTAIAARIGHEVADGWVDARVTTAEWLLYDLVVRAEVIAYANELLSPLDRHDRRQRTELLRTLEAYVACGTSKTETAQVLHLKRQSLYARLERISEILKVDLTDHDVIFALELAVRVRRLRATRDQRTPGTLQATPG